MMSSARRYQLKKRIDELCKLIVDEQNATRMLQLSVELDELLAEYLGESPPTPSTFLQDAERLYNPTRVDIEWAQSMMQLIQHTGELVMPAAQLIYRVDHQHKVMTLQNPEQLSHFDSFVTHLQTVKVWKLIGYTVNERKPS